MRAYRKGKILHLTSIFHWSSTAEEVIRGFSALKHGIAIARSILRLIFAILLRFFFQRASVISY